ncbi:OPT/YSL family transporter [Serratia sp. BNK-12]|uniref:OPT/YSL family transporter n=1 Tax=Serratia sp. BNK-12 TaxID=3376149 RepID=UPI0039BFA7B2
MKSNTTINPLKDIGTLLVMVILSIVGAIIGVQLITTLGVTPNTSIIGALFAMLLARIPLQMFQRYRSVHTQNLAQTVISSATFGAANSLLMPIAVPYVMGQPQLILPMFCGVAVAMLLDAYLLYRMFDTKIFPAANAWPPGVAAAEAIKAGDRGANRPGCWWWAWRWGSPGRCLKSRWRPSAPHLSAIFGLWGCLASACCCAPTQNLWRVSTSMRILFLMG